MENLGLRRTLGGWVRPLREGTEWGLKQAFAAVRAVGVQGLPSDALRVRSLVGCLVVVGAVVVTGDMVVDGARAICRGSGLTLWEACPSAWAAIRIQEHTTADVQVRQGESKGPCGGGEEEEVVERGRRGKGAPSSDRE